MSALTAEELIEKRRQAYHSYEGKIDHYLKVGAVALIHSDWLLEYYDKQQNGKKKPIPKRQEIEEDRVENRGAQVEWSVWDGKMKHRASVIVVSYPWLAKDHPDPNCWHLERVCAFIRHLKTNFPQEMYVFWDYMSLYQKPRTSEQDIKFREALMGMDIWYAHETTNILALPILPTCADGEPPLIPYTKRGWCTFEQQVYSLASKGNRIYTIDADLKFKKASQAGSDILRVPATPSDFREMLKSRVFTNHADAETVANLYERVFNTIAGSFRSLEFSYLLKDTNAPTLTRYFTACKLTDESITLEMSHNKQLTDYGAAQVIKALVQSKNTHRLEKILLQNSAAGSLSCLLALAFIPRDGDGNLNPDVDGDGNYLLSSAQNACHMYLGLEGCAVSEQCVAALRYVFGLTNLAKPPNGQRGFWVDGKGDKNKRMAVVWSVGDHCAVEPDKLLMHDAAGAVVWKDGSTYVGGTDVRGKAMGFGKLWSPTAGDGMERECQEGFFLDGKPLPNPLTVDAINALETAILKDAVVRETVPTEAVVGPEGESSTLTPGDCGCNVPWCMARERRLLAVGSGLPATNPLCAHKRIGARMLQGRDGH
eukprot:GDKI01008538.1.p1 GENE.GDKI01008538.1~~GDKI01008538.1.p1  ORF type:complete len:596 (-),score=140.14 GDKI01008538.1:90-1877(-)